MFCCFKRKTVAYLLVLSVFFTTLFNTFVLVVSAEPDKKSIWEQLKKTPSYFLTQLGALVSGEFDQMLANSEAFHNWIYGIENDPAQTTIVINNDGTVTLSEEGVQQLRDLFDEYLAENPEVIDVVWLPVITEKNLKASWFSSLEDYGRSSALLNTHDLVAFRSPNVQFNIGDSYLGNGVYADLSNIVMYGDLSDTLINAINYITPNFGVDTTTGTIFRCGFAEENGTVVAWWKLDWQFYDTDNGSWVSAPTTGANNFYMLLNPFFKGSLPWKNQDIYILCASSSSGIHYVPYFKSLSAYKDYVTGNGSYYRFDSGYTGGDITINPDADYSEITDAIRDVMQEAINSGKSVTAALTDMQKAFTSALDKLNESLGDISDNTAQTNTWLQKIYELLEQQQKELQDYLESSGQSLDDLIGLLSHTDSSGFRTSIYDLLGSFLLLFRVQQEDLQAFMEDAQNFFKMQPIKIGVFIEAAKQDIVNAIEKVVEAVNGISINIDYGDVDGGSDGESLWTQLGKGLAKILTAVLDLLKVLIFKGLDALGYLAGVMIANIGQVFEGIGVYFDRYIGYIEENTFFAAIKDILPEELQTIMVLSFFSIAVAGIIKYAKKG